MAAAGVLAACTAGPPEIKDENAAQAAARYTHEQAVAADVAAIIEGMAAAEGQTRAELLRRAKP